MDQLSKAREIAASAAGLEAVLAAAYAGFMTMLPVIGDQQEPDSPLFVTYVMAGAAAASGRLALAAAPSLPDSWRSVTSIRSETCGGTADEIADSLARLCQVIARRLYDAALTAADADDREACSRGSHHARQLSELLCGGPAS